MGLEYRQRPVASDKPRTGRSRTVAPRADRTAGINLIYDNQCAVVIAGFGYSRSQSGPTVEIAAANGMKMCEESGAKECQIYYKACSLPEQIQ